MNHLRDGLQVHPGSEDAGELGKCGKIGFLAEDVYLYATYRTLFIVDEIPFQRLPPAAMLEASLAMLA